MDTFNCGREPHVAGGPVTIIFEIRSALQLPLPQTRGQNRREGIAQSFEIISAISEISEIMMPWRLER